MVDQDREGELRRLRAFVAPFEAVLRIGLEVGPLGERLAVDQDLDAVDRAVARVGLHRAGFCAFTSAGSRATSGKIQSATTMKGPRKATAHCGPTWPREPM